jgi:hypothetical protein
MEIAKDLIGVLTIFVAGYIAFLLGYALAP